MTNLNLVKLIVGMQIQLRSIIAQATDMESALNEIMDGVEKPHVTHAPPSLPETGPVQPVRSKRSIHNSNKMKAYWAGPEGEARRAAYKANSKSKANASHQ